MLCLWAWCALCFRGNSNDGSEWGCGIFLLNYKKFFISTTAKPLTTKLSRRVTYFEGNPTIRSWDRVWLWDKLNSLYLHYQNAYGHQNLQDGDLPSHMTLRPHGLCEVKWQTKTMPTTTVPMSTKRGKMVTYLSGLLPIKSDDVLCGLVRSCDNFRTYLQYHNALGPLTSQGCDTQWGAPNHKVTWSFNHVVFRGQKTN